MFPQIWVKDLKSFAIDIFFLRTLTLFDKFAYYYINKLLLIDSCLFNPSYLSWILYSLSMSNSHRKPIEDDFESYSFTEEFRPKKKDDTNRTRNKIEPNHPSK